MGFVVSLIAAAMIGPLSPSAGFAEDSGNIRWVVKSHEEQKVDRFMATRLYDEACRWVEDNFSPDGRTLRPRLTIHVGEGCPDSKIGKARPCLSPAASSLYLPTWDASAPGAIIQATIVVGMLHLAQQQDIPQIAESLLAEDTRNFLSARTLSSKEKE
jgi:hypothetical protein